MSSRGLLFLIPVALAAIVCAQDPMGIFPRTEDLHGLWKNVTPKDLPFKHELQPGGACSVSLSGQVSGSYQSTSGKTFLITAGPAQSSPI
jgi:hypothetical protein